MSIIANTVMNALMISALYALIAIGFTLIFSVGGILNLAHGAQITIGAFGAYIVAKILNINLWVGLVVGMIAAAFSGVLLYVLIVRHIEDDPINVMILTIVSGFVIQHIFRIFITSGTISFGLFVPGDTTILGATVENNMLVIFFLSWLVIFLLVLFINYTRVGMAIVAMSNSQRGATLVGINSTKINLYTWTIAGLLAGLAGVFLASFETGSWDMGLEPLILAFSIVILGGLGSFRGSIIGAYVIGTMEVITITFVDPKLLGFSALLVLLVVLLARPQGFYGHEIEFT